LARPGRGGVGPGLPGGPADGHRRLARLADPDPVRRPDRDGVLPARPARPALQDAVPDGAVPPAGPGRAGGVAVRVRDPGADGADQGPTDAGDLVQPADAGDRRHRLLRLGPRDPGRPSTLTRAETPTARPQSSMS